MEDKELALWIVNDPEAGLRTAMQRHAPVVKGILARMLPGRRMETRLYDPERPMTQAAFGIREPDPGCPLVGREEIDLILVPAVCYDRQGYRLGFGGGYYDRWLTDSTAFRVGMCRTAVLQDHVPVEAHDTRVDVLLTERESLSFPAERKGGA